MKKRLTTLLAGTTLCIGSAFAQTDVSGMVVSYEDNAPVIGATVKVVGTKLVTVTDAQGRFRLNCPKGNETLRISYIGMEPIDIIARKNVRIVLKTSNSELDEVVVTALGITRKQKALGYAASTLKSDVLTEGRMTDVTNALAGKVAGLTVNSTSSDPGQVGSVIIRGVSSINGNNQPLYVIDGVPLSTTTFSESALGGDHYGAIGGLSSVNPNDIADMTVLKGAAATALYGSRAANGVILITTKSGKHGKGRNFSVTYDGGLQTRSVSVLPDLQNKYGQGWNGGQTYIENGSWGPEMDGSQQVFGPIWNNQQLIHEYSAVEDNIKDFFETGVSTSHSIAMSGASADNKMNYYLSYSYTKDDGIMPSDKDSYQRNTIAMRGSYEATDWLKLSSNMNLATSKTDAVGQFQGTSVIDGLYEFPRDISLVDKQDLSSAFNTPEAYFTPYGITNPYWAIANNYNHTDSKQVYGKIQADITPIKDLTLTYRLGFDYTDYDAKVGAPEINLDDALINDDMGYPPSGMNQSGYVYTTYQRKYEMNHDFLANYQKKFFDNRFDMNITAGVNMNERSQTTIYGQTDGLTFYSGFWDLSNGATKTLLSEGQSKRRLVGLFGDVSLSWDEMLFLSLTARNDWSSTLPIKDNSFFYPGATLSWLFSNLIPKNDYLSMGKVRLAFGKTGNDAAVYQTGSRYVQAYADGYYGYDLVKFPFNGTNAFQAYRVIGSSTLKPEMTTEVEAGLNLALFKGRVNIDLSYYHKTTADQIFTLPVDPSTGFTNMVTNFGKVQNKGVELLVNTTPVRTRNWRWDLGFNFSKNKNKVISMPAGLEGGKAVINSFSAGNDAVYMYAEEGKPIGELYTYMPTYTADGAPIVDANGMPVLTTKVVDTGKNVNNDWTGGVTTSLSAYGFTLSAALDIRQGGYMFSRTKNLMQFTGNGTISTYNDRRPFIIPGSVVDNGDGTYSPNTTPIYLADGSYQTYFNEYGYGHGGEAYLIDRSYVKLRNITLAYALPSKCVSKIKLSGVTLSVFCNNVFTWTAKDNYYIDPEVSSWGNDLRGLFGELYSNPSCRTFGFNLTVKL